MGRVFSHPKLFVGGQAEESDSVPYPLFLFIKDIDHQKRKKKIVFFEVKF